MKIENYFLKRLSYKPVTKFVSLGLFVVIIILGSVTHGLAANRFAVATGNWNGAIWATKTNGVPGSAATPVAGDNVTINGGVTVTVNIATAVCSDLKLGQATAGVANLTFAASSQLTMSGNLDIGATSTGTINMTSGGTFIYNGNTITINNAGTWTPGAGTVQFGATVTIPTTFFTSFNNLTIAGGTVTVTNNKTLNGNLLLSGGTLSFSAGLTVTLNGNFTQTGTGGIDTPSGTNVLILFNKSGTQTYSVASFANIKWVQYIVATTSYLQLLSNLNVYGSVSWPSVLTINGTLDAAASICGNSGTGGCTFSVASTGTLITKNTLGLVSGTNGTVSTSFATARTFNAAAQYIFNGTSAQVTSTEMPASFISGGSVTINNSAGVTLSQATAFGSGATLFLTAGSFTNGSLLTMNNGSLINRDLGSVSSVPTFAATVNVTYSGSTAVTSGNELPAGSVNLGNLTVNKSGGVTLNADAQVNGTLTLTSGNLILGTKNLALAAASSAIAGAPFSNTKMVVADGGGELRKLCSSNAQANYTFPVGDGAASANGAQYTPLVTASSAGTTYSGAYIGIKVNDLKHANNQSTANYLSRYWTVTQSGITGGAFTTTITGTYSGVGSEDIVGTESNISAAQLSGVFNQATNPWIKYSALGTNTLTASSALLVSGVGSVFTGITGAAPTVSISGTTTICSGSGTTLTAAGVGDPSITYLWSTGATTAAMGPVTPLANTTYTVTATDGNGLKGSNSQLVTVKANAGISSATAAASPICATATTNITANGIAGDGAILTWWTGTGGTGTNLGSSNPLTAGPGTYYARVTGDCGSPVEASVTVGTKTNVSISSATAAASPICATATTNITANGIAGDGAILTWWTGTGGTGTNLGSSNPLTVGPGTYYARVTGDCGSPVETSVTVGTKTNVSITSATAAASPICATATTNISANGIAGNGAILTWWTGTGGTGTNLGSSNPLTVGPGTYYARVTGDCGSPVEASVTVGTKTNVSISSATAAASPICATATTNITANGIAGDGASLIWWTGAGGTGSNLGSSNPLTVGPGTYYAQVTGDCASPVETSVTVGSYSLPSITSQPIVTQTICEVANATISIAATGSNLNYQWFRGTNALTDGDYISGASTNSLTLLNLDLSNAATNYHCIVSNGCSPDADSDNSELVVSSSNPLITKINSLAGPTTSCNGDTALFTAIHNLVSSPDRYFIWGPGANTSIVKFSNTRTGTYVSGPFITASDLVYVKFGGLSSGISGYNVNVRAITNCLVTAEDSVWVRGSTSTPGAITGSKVACSSQTAVPYSCDASVGAETYLWTFSVPGAVFTGQGTKNVTVDFPAFTSGQLCVKAGLNCGTPSLSPSRCMTVANKPSDPGAMTGLARVCPGQTGVVYAIAAIPGAGSNSYNWTVPPGATISGVATGNSISVNFPNPYATLGYTVNVNVSSPCSGVGVTTTRGMAVNSNTPGTPANITGPLTAICNQTQVTYTAAVPSGVYTGWTWGGTTLSGSPANGITNIVYQGQSVKFDVAPPFVSGTLTVIGDNNACSPTTSSSARTITISSTPAKPTSIAPASVCMNFPVTFTASPIPPTGTNYQWYFSSGTITGTNPNNTGTINGIWGAAASGNVQVTAKNTCGNSSTLVQSVTAITCKEVGLITEQNNFAVYPNPAHDKLTISLNAKEQQNYFLKLMDVAGRIVWAESMTAIGGSNEYNIYLNALPKGIYMLQVQSATDIWNRKIVFE